MRPHLALALVPIFALVFVLGIVEGGQDPDKSEQEAVARASLHEPEALAFVREHHPELARVLESLRPRDPAEYRKAVGELSLVARNLAEIRGRNPRRYELALEAWKARSRVELLAAQLAGAPSEELRSQLRLAIEAKVDAEIRRQRFELDQAEATARKLRESLDRLENQRDVVVEARFRALQPKKARGARSKDGGPAAPVAVPASPTSATPREDRP